MVTITIIILASTPLDEIAMFTISALQFSHLLELFKVGWILIGCQCFF